MSSSQDALRPRLDDVATMACYGVPGCDAATVSVVSGADVLTLGTTSPGASRVDEVQYALGDGPCLQALRTGDVVRVADHRDDRRWPAVAAVALQAGLRSSLSVPLRHGARALGSLNLHARRADVLGAACEQVGDVLARQAAHAVWDLASSGGRRVLHGTELRVSHVLRRHLAPAVPVLPGITSAARYLPADDSAEVGGDWYDAFLLPHATIGVAIGDVMGHDIAAAVEMGQLRSVLRSCAYDGSRPGGVLDRLDRLVQDFDMGLATAFYGTLHLDRGGACLVYSNAGHLPPLVRDPDGTVRTLHDGSSWLIGVPSAQLGARTDAAVWLPRGSTVLLYTDGLVERHRRHLDEGIARLTAALSGPVPDGGPEGLCDRVLERMSDDGCTDDRALLALRVD